jgi:hypothetical protein
MYTLKTTSYAVYGVSTIFITLLTPALTIYWLDRLRGITRHRLSLFEGSADFEGADEANRAR